MEKELTEAVLVYPVLHQNVLLALKTGKIGAGCLNGYGGGVEKGETPIEAACREFREEGGCSVNREFLVKVAEAFFHNTNSDGETFTCKVHIFVIHELNGFPVSTREMVDPNWYPFAALNESCLKLMPADYYWMREVLSGAEEGKKYRVEARYGPRQKYKIGPVKVEEVSSFD